MNTAKKKYPRIKPIEDPDTEAAGDETRTDGSLIRSTNGLKIRVRLHHEKEVDTPVAETPHRLSLPPGAPDEPGVSLLPVVETSELRQRYTLRRLSDVVIETTPIHETQTRKAQELLAKNTNPADAPAAEKVLNDAEKTKPPRLKPPKLTPPPEMLSLSGRQNPALSPLIGPPRLPMQAPAPANDLPSRLAMALLYAGGQVYFAYPSILAWFQDGILRTSELAGAASLSLLVAGLGLARTPRTKVTAVLVILATMMTAAALCAYRLGSNVTALSAPFSYLPEGPEALGALALFGGAFVLLIGRGASRWVLTGVAAGAAAMVPVIPVQRGVTQVRQRVSALHQNVRNQVAARSGHRIEMADGQHSSLGMTITNRYSLPVPGDWRPQLTKNETLFDQQFIAPDGDIMMTFFYEAADPELGFDEYVSRQVGTLQANQTDAGEFVMDVPGKKNWRKVTIVGSNRRHEILVVDKNTYRYVLKFAGLGTAFSNHRPVINEVFARFDAR